MSSRPLKDHVKRYYGWLFQGKHPCALPILTGRDLAKDLGYPLDLLDGVIPDACWNWFFPCGNLLPHINPCCGQTILNLGCGAAVDSFSVLLQYGPDVRLVNLDIVAGVVVAARSLARDTALHSEMLEWACGDGEDLPFQNASFDCVIMNGVFNLFPDKLSLLEEVHRVLKPAGCLAIADLCCTDTLPSYFSEEPDAWAWCMSGACTEIHMRKLLDLASFDQVRVLPQEEDDPFYRIVVMSKRRI